MDNLSGLPQNNAGQNSQFESPAPRIARAALRVTRQGFLRIPSRASLKKLRHSRPNSNNTGTKIRLFAAAWLSGMGIICAVVLNFHGIFGFRLFDVTTPSMGAAAPVGSLIVTKSVQDQTLEPGDIITFRPENQNNFYTHRITRIHEGKIETQGDLNNTPDPWVVQVSDIVGRETLTVPGGGWVVRALPWLALGWTLVWFLTRLHVSYVLLARVRLVGYCMVTSGVIFWLKPWTRGQIIAQNESGGGLDATVVATGALPMDVTARSGGAKVHIEPGRTGTVHSIGTISDGGDVTHQFIPSIALDGWWLIGVTLTCLSPLLYCIFIGLPDYTRNSEGDPENDSNHSPPGMGEKIQNQTENMPIIHVTNNHSKNKSKIHASLIASTIFAISAIFSTSTVPATRSAPLASISNNTNTARVLKSCMGAVKYAPIPTVAYALDGGGLTQASNGSTEPDIREVNSSLKSPGTFQLEAPSTIPVVNDGPCNAGGNKSLNFNSSAPGGYYYQLLYSDIPFTPSRTNKVSVSIWFRQPNTGVSDGFPIVSLAESSSIFRTILPGSGQAMNYFMGQAFRLSIHLDGRLYLGMQSRDTTAAWGNSNRYIVRQAHTLAPGSGGVNYMDDNWHHAVVTIDPSSSGNEVVKLYVDGQAVDLYVSGILQTSVNLGNWGDQADQYWRIGNQIINFESGYPYYYTRPDSMYNSSTAINTRPKPSFFGRLALFSAYHGRVLTPAEVSVLYNSRL